jgi:hypothetical protein
MHTDKKTLKNEKLSKKNKTTKIYNPLFELFMTYLFVAHSYNILKYLNIIGHINENKVYFEVYRFFRECQIQA